MVMISEISLQPPQENQTLHVGAPVHVAPSNDRSLLPFNSCLKSMGSYFPVREREMDFLCFFG